MKVTKYSLVEAALSSAVRSLRTVAKDKNLPDMFKERIRQLAEEMKGHDIEQYREPLVAVVGDVLTISEVRELIKKASGYVKWDVVKVESEAGEELGLSAETFRDMFGLDVKDGDVVVYDVTRITDDRNAVFTLSFSCIAGQSYLAYSTDRVGMESNAPIDNDKLLQYLKREVFN